MKRPLSPPFVVILPASLLMGCVSYGPRTRVVEGDETTCYRQLFSNPPSKTEVSCDAPIVPPAGDGEWCTVAPPNGHTVRINCE